MLFRPQFPRNVSVPLTFGAVFSSGVVRRCDMTPLENTAVIEPYGFDTFVWLCCVFLSMFLVSYVFFSQFPTRSVPHSAELRVLFTVPFCGVPLASPTRCVVFTTRSFRCSPSFSQLCPFHARFPFAHLGLARHGHTLGGAAQVGLRDPRRLVERRQHARIGLRPSHVQRIVGRFCALFASSNAQKSSRVTNGPTDRNLSFGLNSPIGK